MKLKPGHLLGFAAAVLAVSSVIWWPIQPSAKLPSSPISVEPRDEPGRMSPLPRPSRPPHPPEIYRVPTVDR